MILNKEALKLLQVLVFDCDQASCHSISVWVLTVALDITQSATSTRKQQRLSCKEPQVLLPFPIFLFFKIFQVFLHFTLYEFTLLYYPPFN